MKNEGWVWGGGGQFTRRAESGEVGANHEVGEAGELGEGLLARTGNATAATKVRTHTAKWDRRSNKGKSKLNVSVSVCLSHRNWLRCNSA